MAGCSPWKSNSACDAISDAATAMYRTRVISKQIAPYFEIITPQSNAKLNDWLFVDPLELNIFFERIQEIDHRLFGRIWEPQPPLVGNKCMRHQFSCMLTSKGDVMPCVGVTLAMGNIRRQPLREIIAGSQILKDLKDYRHLVT